MARYQHSLLQLYHHDRASLLAGKLHAILQRPYLKGRDVYDLFWYLGDSRWPAPNLNMLNNALRQTNWEGPLLTETTWRQTVQQRLLAADWRQIVADVHPFLEDEKAIELLTPENLEKVLVI